MGGCRKVHTTCRWCGPPPSQMCLGLSRLLIKDQGPLKGLGHQEADIEDGLIEAPPGIRLPGSRI